MITAYSRGNPITFINNEWVYEDGVALSKEDRPCARCGKPPTEEGYDACLGHIDGVTSACCGHGKEEAYVVELVKEEKE